MPPGAIAEIHLAGFDAQRPLPDRHARRAGRAGRLGALRPRDRALRPAADADRVGHRHSAARHAAARGRDGAIDAGRARCPRCVNCSRRSPTPCSRADGARAAVRDRRTGARRRTHRDLPQRGVRQLPQRARRDLSGGEAARRRAVLQRGRRRVRPRASVDQRRPQRLRRCVRAFLCRLSACAPTALSPRRRAPRMGDRRSEARGGCATRRPTRCWPRWRRWRRSGLPAVRLRARTVVPARRLGAIRSCASGR